MAPEGSSDTQHDVRLEVAQVGPDDRGEQARLFNRCFKKDVSASDLAWRYDDNPHGRAISLVYRPPAAEAVCSFAYMPRLAVSHGDDATGGLIGQQGDVMTDPDWRRRGLVMKLAQECAAVTQGAGWPLNWGFPNRMSASVFLKIGWKSVGLIRPYDFYFKSDAAARRLRFAAGRVASAGLPLARRTRCVPGRKRLAAEAGADYRVVPLERFPNEVDALSREVERRFPLMVRRSAEYLNWRFLDTPSKRHRALGVERGGKLAGYAVLQPPGPDGVAYVVDLLAPEPSAVSAALAASFDHLEAAGATLARATAVDGSWWQGTLQGAGFLAPKPENVRHVYTFLQDEKHPLAAPSRDASKWYLTDGDRDDELMG